MKRFKSAKDPLTCILVFGAILASAAYDYFVPQAGLKSFLCKLPLVLLILWVYFGSWYELRGNYICCSYGPIKDKIYYSRIKNVKLTENGDASYALSKMRIAIKQYGNKSAKSTTMISPKNREEFISELEDRCLNLETDVRRMKKTG